MFNVERIIKIFKLVTEVRGPVQIMITMAREMTSGGGGLAQSWWMVSKRSKKERRQTNKDFKNHNKSDKKM